MAAATANPIPLIDFTEHADPFCQGGSFQKNMGVTVAGAMPERRSHAQARRRRLEPPLPVRAVCLHLDLAVAPCTISICDYSLNQKATKEVDLPWLTLFVPGLRRRAGSGFALEFDGQVKLSDD
jgi:hypothetical protein